MFRMEDKLDYRRLRNEGTGLTYWNAGYLQHMPISSDLSSTTTTGKSLTYNGTEWTSSFTSEIGGLPINTTIPLNDGQVLTYNGTSTSWTNEYPRNLRGTPVSSILPTSGQILGYNGINWIPVNNTGTQGPAGTVAFGNTIVVDSKLGNDLSGSVDGNAVKTIQTAISKVNALTPARPITIWVMPGTYDLSGDLNAQGGITIPDNTTLRGVTLQGCIIQRTGVSSNTTLITMGVNSRLEDFTLNLSSSSNVELKAVYFPNQTPTSAKVRVCLINVTSTVGSLTNIVCGIFSDGSTSNPNPDVVRSTNAVQRSTTNVTASSGGGIVRGWYFTGALQFSVRDTVIFANGANSIGVETTNTSSFIIIKTSTIAGTLYDLKQPSGLTVQNSGIQLCATDLVNANSDDNGFTVNTEATNLYFSVTGTNIGDGTHYLFPGTVSFNSLVNAPLGIPFSQNIICFGGILTGVSDAMSGSATINLYNSTSATSLSPSPLTPFATLTINNTNKVVLFNNKSTTFKKSINFLHIQLITSDVGNSLRGLLLGLSLY